MRALVTGGGGFLGSWVVRQLLERGDRVRTLARGDYPEIAALGAECLKGDVERQEDVLGAAQGMDVVFHVAGKPGIWGSKESYWRPNVLGTRHVIEACKKQGVPRLVFTGSPSSVFGEDEISGGDESLPYPEKYLCWYPHTKAEAERQVLAAHQPGKLHTVSLRPHLIWGPGDRFLIPKMVDAARTGRIKRVGDGENLVSVTYVENAASAHLAAAGAIEAPDSPAGGKAYFIADPEPVKLWPFIDQVLRGLGAPPITGHVSYRAARTIGGVLELVYRVLGKQDEPRMTRFLAAQLGKPHWFRIDAARRELHWTPAIDTGEGLRRLFASWGR